MSQLSQIDSAPHRGGAPARSDRGDLKRKPCKSWAVHFAGGQEIKWALDEDLRWARKALDGDLRLTSAWRSRIVHAAWWPSAWVHGNRRLGSQKVVCFSDNAPSFYARQPEFYAVRPFVDRVDSSVPPGGARIFELGDPRRSWRHIAWIRRFFSDCLRRMGIHRRCASNWDCRPTPM